MKVNLWRNTLGCPEKPIVKICLGPIPGGSQFFPFNMPLETAEAIFGKEVVDLIGEDAVEAEIILRLEEEG